MGQTFSRIVLVAGILATCGVRALAADIAAEPVPGTSNAIISIEGNIESGDEVRFANVALRTDQAIVVLSSPGGNLVAAMEIGRAIRLKGFSTLVPDGFGCASACAIAWLGGATRYMGPGAKIGFHAASMAGQDQADSAANAVMGAYLNQLGLPLNAIVYVTTPQPTEIQWLTFADAEEIGIDVKPFQLARKEADTPPAAPTKPATPPAMTPFDDWASYGEWIQAASRDELWMASEVAIGIGRTKHDAFVFTTDNGWYVVALGPYAKGTAEQARARLVAKGIIPSDSMVKTGAYFRQLVIGERPRRLSAGGSSGSEAEPTGAGSAGATSSVALQAAQAFYRASSLPGAEALAYLDGIYSPTVSYFGKPTPKADVMAEKAAFMDRWPERLYTIDPNAISASCASNGTCEATGKVKWRAYSRERDATSIGTAEFRLSFATTGSLSVVSESSEVLSRSIYKGH